MTQQQELIPMAAGEFLQQQRMLRKLDLASIASAIGLDEGLLRKIEEEQADHIAPVYRKGYIQAYAAYLQIPPDEMQPLIDRVTSQETSLRKVFINPAKRNPVDHWIRASSYVLASLLIGTLAWQFTHEAVRLSQKGALPYSASQAGPVNASIASLDVLNDGVSKQAATADLAWAEFSKAPLPDGEGRLQVSVSADSWVEIVAADGTELEMDLIRGGSKKNYQGRMPFRILIGRASAVSLSLNGEMVDMAPFIKDDVVQMTWPQNIESKNQND